MKIPFHLSCIGPKEIKEVAETLHSGWLTTGPKVKAFEEKFAAYQGAKYAVGVTSATAALHLSLIALGIKGKDEVITTPITFAATANVIVMVGAKPVFADVELDSMNIDPIEIEKKVSKFTKAIIPVHFAGQPCKLDKIYAIARKHKLKIINDCAHSIESEFKNKKLGAYPDVSCYSFYPIKNMTTAEGGMVTTSNKELAEKIRILRLHGLSKEAYERYGDKGYKHYEVTVLGYKYNMTDLQASLGIHQLDKLDIWLARRKRIVDRYDKAFFKIRKIKMLKVGRSVRSAYHIYPILVPRRDEIIQRLQEYGIGCGVHFTALHLHKFYRERYHYHKGMFPNAEYIGDHTLSLPLYPRLTDEQVGYVIKTVERILCS